MLLVLIFITCFFKSQERVYAAEMEVECVLHKVEICNICWHDFNSELCPHTKGVIYGGNECKTYDEKDCNIYSLIMNMHGTPTEIFSDVGSSPMRMSIQDVEKLKTKPVQRLVLLQCSVGKIEKAGENIALAFARSVTGKVLAGDGVVNQNEVNLNKKENNIGDDFCKEGQNIFVRYYVDDEGWYIYKHDWNERVVKYTYAAPNGKMYRLYQLINMLDT